jgi:Rrf2 family iron-sulfur cluster assembly transcriptional regulator
MKLSTKGRYAVRILTCIARNQALGPVCKALISEEEGVSKDYIEQIVVTLKRDGLVIGQRGMKGGFLLAKDADEITLFDILSAAEGCMSLVECADCKRSQKCKPHDVWVEASTMLNDYFKKITLTQLT